MSSCSFFGAVLRGRRFEWELCEPRQTWLFLLLSCRAPWGCGDSLGPALVLYYTQLESGSVDSSPSRALETKCEASGIGSKVDAQQCSVPSCLFPLPASPSSLWQPIFSHTDLVSLFILFYLESLICLVGTNIDCRWHYDFIYILIN